MAKAIKDPYQMNLLTAAKTKLYNQGQKKGAEKRGDALR